VNQGTVERLILALRGRGEESAACALGAMGPTVVPALRAEFSSSAKPSVRRTIVEIIGEFRRAEDLPFFAAALLDDDERVWQAAIDAVVSQPSPEALALTRAVLDRIQADRRSSERKLSFIREAAAELQKPHPFEVGERDGGNA
jgi:HEAT repeat protein